MFPLRASLRGKLLLASLLPVVLAIAGLGIYLTSSLQQLFLEQLRDEVRYQAALTAAVVGPPLAAGRPLPPLETILRPLDATSPPDLRIVVVDGRGQLVASSLATDRDALGSFFDLPGLAEALEGEETDGIAPSRVLSGEVLYVALPVRVGSEIVGAVRISHQLADLGEALTRLRVVIMLGMVLAMLVATAVAGLLSATLSRPLREVAEALRHVGAGRLPPPLPVRSDDEVGRVAASLNEMAARLAALEESRRALLADISHELRAPIAACTAAVEALEAGAADEPRRRGRLLRGIGDEMRRLARLTEDLAQVAQLEAGSLELRQDLLALTPLVQSVVNSYAAQAERQSVRLRFTPPPQPPMVWGDADRLAQVLRNLLDNALKFTPPGSSVSVELLATAQRVELAVADEGPGFPPEEVEHAFERFYRGRVGRRTDRGMGLGLAICRAIVEAHGGSVAVDHTMARGARVVVTLPLAVAEEIAPTPAEVAALGDGP